MMILNYHNVRGVNSRDIETKQITIVVQGIEYSVSDDTCGGLVVSKRMVGKENTHLKRTFTMTVVEPNRIVVK